MRLPSPSSIHDVMSSGPGPNGTVANTPNTGALAAE
jgi:hypothetical protein